MVSFGNEKRIFGVILAGGKCPSSLEKRTNVSYKALIQIAGKPLLKFILDAFNALPWEKHILLVCDKSCGYFAHEEAPTLKILDGTFSVPDALERATSWFQDEFGEDILEENLVVSSCDIPFVTGDILKEIITEGEKLDADLVWPIAERRNVEAKFQGCKRTYVKTKEGTFTGGNIFLVRPRVIINKLALFRRLFAHRKNPLAMASIFGPSLVMKLLFTGISIPDMERDMGARLGVKLRALITPHSEVAVDLDKVSDFEMMERLFREEKALNK